MILEMDEMWIKWNEGLEMTGKRDVSPHSFGICALFEFWQLAFFAMDWAWLDHDWSGVDAPWNLFSILVEWPRTLQSRVYSASGCLRTSNALDSPL